jgi:hypothetical protein
MFKKGTLIVDKNNIPQYEKLDDDDWGWWVSLTSNYLVEKKVQKEVLISKTKDVDVEVDEELIDLSNFKKVKKEEIEHELRPESEKPLYRNGKLNRFGFRWTDKQVNEYYPSIGWKIVEN